MLGTRAHKFRGAAVGQLARFLAASALSFCMTVGLAEGYRYLGMRPEAAFALTLAMMTCISFGICRVWVFRGSRRPIWSQLAGFALTSLAFRTSEFVAFLVVYSWLGLPYTFCVVGVLGVSALAKFMLLRTFVFAKAKPTSAMASQQPSGRPTLGNHVGK
jgi:putative flippase GtrA